MEGGWESLGTAAVVISTRWGAAAETWVEEEDEWDLHEPVVVVAPSSALLLPVVAESFYVRPIFNAISNRLMSHLHTLSLLAIIVARPNFPSKRSLCRNLVPVRPVLLVLRWRIKTKPQRTALPVLVISGTTTLMSSRCKAIAPLRMQRALNIAKNREVSICLGPPKKSQGKLTVEIPPLSDHR